MKASTSQKPLFPLAVVGHHTGSISKELGTSNRSVFSSSKPAPLNQISHLCSCLITEVRLLYAECGVVGWL